MKVRPSPSSYQQQLMLHVISHHPADLIIGIDEVGFGPWAGPLVVGGVVACQGWDHPVCRDSKAFSSQASRERALAHISSQWVYGMVAGMEAADVDQLGVGPALAQLVVRTASELLALYPSAILVQDGDIPTPVPGCTNANMAWMPEADVLVPAVSAASMLAKVTRDIDMVQYSMVFPEYGFESNKGYGTAKHEQALMTYGPCPIHRFSYKPVRRYMLQSASWQSPQRKTGIDVWTSYHSPSQPGRSAGANS